MIGTVLYYISGDSFRSHSLLVKYAHNVYVYLHIINPLPYGTIWRAVFIGTFWIIRFEISMCGKISTKDY